MSEQEQTVEHSEFELDRNVSKPVEVTFGDEAADADVPEDPQAVDANWQAETEATDQSAVAPEADEDADTPVEDPFGESADETGDDDEEPEGEGEDPFAAAPGAAKDSPRTVSQLVSATVLGSDAPTWPVSHKPDDASEPEEEASEEAEADTADYQWGSSRTVSELVSDTVISDGLLVVPAAEEVDEAAPPSDHDADAQPEEPQAADEAFDEPSEMVSEPADTENAPDEIVSETDEPVEPEAFALEVVPQADEAPGAETEDATEAEDTSESVADAGADAEADASAMAPATNPLRVKRSDRPQLPRVALMGEFSAGKSTLSNLLIGASALPVNVTATQLPPVWIAKGDDQPYRVDLDGSEHDIALDELEQVSVTKTNHIRIFQNAEILDHCDIIDMPGISDPNMAAEVWQRVIHNADIVIWCSHATQAWRQSEAAVWSTMPQELFGRSLLLLTRMDKILSERDRMRVVKRVESETKGLFRSVLPVSLIKALNSSEGSEDWQESGADTLREALFELINEVAGGSPLPRRSNVDEISPPNRPQVEEAPKAAKIVMPTRIRPRTLGSTR